MDNSKIEEMISHSDEDDCRVLEEPESNRIEFKTKAGGLHSEMSALSNSGGGKILIGVNNSNEVIELSKEQVNNQKAMVEDAATDLEPKINYETEIVDGDVLVVEIKDTGGFHRAPDGFYEKEGSSKRKLSREEVVARLEDRGEVSFDQKINREFNFEQDFDEEMFFEFCEDKLNDDKIDPKNFDAKNKLIDLGLAIEDDSKFLLNNAAILMFSKSPRKYFSQAEIICGDFASEERVTVLARDKIREPIPRAIKKATEFVKNHIKSTVDFSEPERSQKPVIPSKVIRESIANAVMHRDYHRRGENINIDIFPDKIIVDSPGTPPTNLAIEKLEGRSIRRNPKLAEVMDDADLAEKMGTGMKRMKLGMETASLPEPLFQIEDNRFKVELLVEELPFEPPEDLNERQVKALKYAHRNGPINNSKYREMFEVSRATAYNDLNGMVNRGLIRKEGSGKNTKYQLRV